MANSPQAIKRVRQNEKVNERQRAQVTAMRTTMKNVELAVSENAENTDELLRQAVKALDMAASKGLIHKNKAAREKSRLSKLVNNQ